MFAHRGMRSAGVVRRIIASLEGTVALAAALVAGALLLAGCANPPPAPLADDPSDPNARARAERYRSATEPYVSRRPAEPKTWGDRNDAVTPQKP
jgi:hypothetical protein